MNELPYFYFVIIGEPQKWPYYAEIPYSAWPDETINYNSNGNCMYVYDREWSYLDVMNWETHENLIVCNAKMFDGEFVQRTRELVKQNLNDGDDLLANSHVAKLLLFLLEDIPDKYRKAGNVIVGSFRCSTTEITALVADLFMRRLQSNFVWDAQSAQLFNSSELRTRHLNSSPLEISIKLANEVQKLFSRAEVKYQGQAEKSTDWWKTIAELRSFVEE
jgi:hypothetical protein